MILIVLQAISKFKIEIKNEKAAGRIFKRLLFVVSGILTILPMRVVLAQSSGNAAPAASAHSAPEAKQFDFWLGEWELAWPGEQTGLPAGQIGRGTNSVKAILDGAVIQENFVDNAPNSLRGMSVSVYNQRLGKWQQTWVDNQGGYLDFAGEFKDGKMILARSATTKDGKEIMQRMVWHNIKPDELDWNWEASQDGGKTWQVNWQIHYKKKQAK